MTTQGRNAFRVCEVLQTGDLVEVFEAVGMNYQTSVKKSDSNTVASEEEGASGVWEHLTNEHTLYVESSFKAFGENENDTLSVRMQNSLTLPTALRSASARQL